MTLIVNCPMISIGEIKITLDNLKVDMIIAFRVSLNNYFWLYVHIKKNQNDGPING